MTTGDDEKNFSVLPASTTGSLSSITTTSLVSERDLGDGDGSIKGNGSEQPDKMPKGYTPEKSWQTLLQVAIPFFIAGLGTIGAGIILGRVEVCRPIDFSNAGNDQKLMVLSVYSSTTY
jgi:solute carrier family 41